MNCTTTVSGASCTSLVFDHSNQPIKSNIYLLISTIDNDGLKFAINYTKTQLKQETCVVNNELCENIIYLLLKIINEDLCKQHIRWPLCDKKMHAQFRTEVKNIVKILNEKYPSARIPILQTSHLITPGRKLLSFFLFLSELAMVEYLKRTCDDDEDQDETDCMSLPLHLTNDKKRNKTKLENLDAVILYELKTYQRDRTAREKIIETSIAESKRLISRMEKYQQEVDNLQQVQIEEIKTEDVFAGKINDLEEFANCLDKIKFCINLLNAPEKITLKFTADLLTNPKRLVDSNVLVGQQLCLKPFLELVLNILKKNIIYIKRMEPKGDMGRLERVLDQHSVQYEIKLKELNLWLPWLKTLLKEANAKVTEYHEELLSKYDGADLQIIDENLSDSVQLIFFDRITPVKRCASNNSNSIFGRFSTISSKKNRTIVPRSNSVGKEAKKKC